MLIKAQIQDINADTVSMTVANSTREEALVLSRAGFADVEIGDWVSLKVDGNICDDGYDVYLTDYPAEAGFWVSEWARYTDTSVVTGVSRDELLAEIAKRLSTPASTIPNEPTAAVKSKKLQAVIFYNERITAPLKNNPHRRMWLDWVDGFDMADGMGRFILRAGFDMMPSDWVQEFTLDEIPDLLKEMGDLRHWTTVKFD